MPRLDSVQIGGKYRGLWIGKSGSRKTCSLKDMPKKLYVFDFDGRIEPLALHMTKEEQREVDFDTYKVGDIQKAQNKMESLLKYNPYSTIAFDSLTAIGDVAVYDSRFARGKGKGKVISGVMMSDMEDYNMESAFMLSVLDFMKKIQCHVVLTAHLLKYEENDVESAVIGKKKITYGLVTAMKKTAAKLPGYFNECYYFQKEVGFEAGSEVVKVFTRATQLGDGAVDAKTALPIPASFDITNIGLWPQIEAAVKEHGTSMNIPEPEPDPNAALPEAGGF